MTDESRAALDRARADRDAAQGRVDGAEMRLREAVAKTLAANVDEIGRQAIQRDIDHARDLGAERVKEVRAALKVETDQAATLLVDPAHSLDWRGLGMSTFGPSDYDVKDAINSFFTRARIRAIVAPLDKAEFDSVYLANLGPADLAPATQHLDERAALLTTREELHEAERALRDAQVANDKADAASLWS